MSCCNQELHNECYSSWSEKSCPGLVRKGDRVYESYKCPFCRSEKLLFRVCFSWDAEEGEVEVRALDGPGYPPLNHEKLRALAEEFKLEN